MTKEKGINYKYNEDKLIEELKDYIDSTYTAHYASSKYQATDYIMDAGWGLGFTLGNVMKYSKRYGSKNGFNRADLMKILHYTMMALFLHDEMQEEGGFGCNDYDISVMNKLRAIVKDHRYTSEQCLDKIEQLLDTEYNNKV